ncbi:MAG: DUF4342 domain-containing protein [Nitrososphaeraceae archaeon]|nr:DUF4342 domain-containing protein [Nitrososphaeraceae archaeon]
MNCAKCGKALSEDMRYCPTCGVLVGKTVERYSVTADNLMNKVKEIIREGNIRRIIVKNEKGETLLEMPATIGVIGALLIPWMAALGVIAAMATRCEIIVEKTE